MRRLLWLAIVLIAGCKPIQTPHAFKLEYPKERTDLSLRFLPAPSGHVALWISTSDDLEDNGRFEGLHVIVDPGSPEDVEKALLPALPDGLPISYVVLTDADPRAEAAARRLAKEHPVKDVLVPAAPHPGKQPRGGTDFLKLGGELTARLVRPKEAQGLAARAFLLRFIDVQFLVLPAGASDSWVHTIAEELEREGLRNTLAWVPGELEAGTLGALEVEAVVGAATPEGVLSFPTKEPLTLGTNGSEIFAPGPLTRSRYAHWIDCRAKPDACGAELATNDAGPLRVTMTVAGQTGSYLLDTRAPVSYLAKPLYEKIPGADAETSHGGHGHGGGPIGLEVPAFRLGDMEIRRWHVLPVEPFSVAGKPVDGVIGMDLLQSFRITWEPKRKKLHLAPNFLPVKERLSPKAAETAGGWEIPMDRSPAGPLLLATLDGRPASLVVDFGAERTSVYLPAEEFAKVPGAKDAERAYFDVPDDLDEAAWAKKNVKAGTLAVKDLNLFGAHFPDTTALAVDSPLDTDVLGLDFLGTFARVSLDFRARTLTLTR